ncbi:3-alpha-hydroxysteroid dehydrogenase [Sphingobacterium sp. ML3W]|uniref:glucose 1-dehydrogenase n=1 Tax=Sphingobacterium sp. ML3W TaxID=1538644 RepID=UPI0004F79625|nr:glucose 1-dehydrogenase [Sphingobacterium sp. ML3W]AIM37221.1 3-alpha-hydroxysteroid dehydrogenase [Sphingobacterium sp. ML3W]
MKKLEGKIALITGAARGMGESHARVFIEEGAKVILTDVNEEVGRALANELGDNALFIKHDVSSLEDWKKVVKLGEEKFGTINILVNNAGILGNISKTADLSEEEYYRVCRINQDGVFFGMKSVIPSMIKLGKGSIINISSSAGFRAHYGVPSVAYTASKFAVRGMTKSAAVEYGPNNIRVNSVHPGFIHTPMMVEATNEDAGDGLNFIPLGRVAQPREVSMLILFLASDDSSFISGEEHVIDGGMLAF